MTILFITRKYPPAIGGMETFSYGLARALGQQCTVLNLKRPWYTWQPYDVIHLGDGVLAGLGVLLKWVTKKPVTITVHGLDVTYRKFGYQTYIKYCLARLDHVIAVSTATANEVTNRLPHCAVTVIANGITPADWPINTELGKNQSLLFVGRLVPRKGCRWFVAEVLPLLPAAVTLDVIGAGPEFDAIPSSDRVRKHGVVSPEQLRRYYQTSRALIMPNIVIPGDMEGFGLVALEAGVCGLPVVAANLEGMKDVIIDGTTGFLVESGNSLAWVKAIQQAIDQPFSASSIRQTVADRFGWDQVKQHYLDLFYGLTATRGSLNERS